MLTEVLRSLVLTEHMGQVVIKAREGIAAMRVTVAENCEQHHLDLLYQGLVLTMIKYGLAILTLSHKQMERRKNTEQCHAHHTWVY